MLYINLNQDGVIIPTVKTFEQTLFHIRWIVFSPGGAG